MTLRSSFPGQERSSWPSERLNSLRTWPCIPPLDRNSQSRIAGPRPDALPYRWRRISLWPPFSPPIFHCRRCARPPETRAVWGFPADCNSYRPICSSAFPAARSIWWSVTRPISGPPCNRAANRTLWTLLVQRFQRTCGGSCWNPGPGEFIHCPPTSIREGPRRSASTSISRRRTAFRVCTATIP